MAKGFSPAACIAAALLVSKIVVGPLIGSARADDNCATAPGAAPPEGQHWYYHIDRATQRKCWYLHATVPLSHAAAEQPTAPAEAVLPVVAPQSPSALTPPATDATSAPQPAAESSNPPSEAVSARPAPHITVLTVKTVTAPFDDAPYESQAAIPKQTGEPPAPPISPANANVPADADTAPVPVAPDAVHDALAPADLAATDAARTQSAHLFLLLALALASAAALIALVGKMAGVRRTPQFSGHPDEAWRSYRNALARAEETAIDEEDAPFLAPCESDGPSDLDVYQWIERSPPAPADFPPARPHQSRQSEQTGPTLKDIELALHILRQARQSITRT